LALALADPWKFAVPDLSKTPAGLLIAHDHLRFSLIPVQTSLSAIRARSHPIESVSQLAGFWMSTIITTWQSNP
jgi:hypothetical protein